MDELTTQQLLTNIRQLIELAQARAVRSVNFERVLLYWNMGKHIVEEEQRGKERADYGSYLIKSLAENLTQEYGSGYSIRQLELCRQFYQAFPITNALRSQLNWTQYRLLLRIENDDKRTYYIEESCNNNWSASQLERQINSQLYERLLLSSDKENVMAVAKKEAKPENPQDIITLPDGQLAPSTYASSHSPSSAS